MDLKMCDRCGELISNFGSMNRIRRKTKKISAVLAFKKERDAWVDGYVELCNSCRCEFDEWIKEKGRNP